MKYIYLFLFSISFSDCCRAAQPVSPMITYGSASGIAVITVQRSDGTWQTLDPSSAEYQQHLKYSQQMNQFGQEMGAFGSAMGNLGAQMGQLGANLAASLSAMSLNSQSAAHVASAQAAGAGAAAAAVSGATQVWNSYSDVSMSSNLMMTTAHGITTIQVLRPNGAWETLDPSSAEYQQYIQRQNEQNLIKAEKQKQKLEARLRRANERRRRADQRIARSLSRQSAAHGVGVFASAGSGASTVQVKLPNNAWQVLEVSHAPTQADQDEQFERDTERAKKISLSGLNSAAPPSCALARSRDHAAGSAQHFSAPPSPHNSSSSHDLRVVGQIPAAPGRRVSPHAVEKKASPKNRNEIQHDRWWLYAGGVALTAVIALCTVGAWHHSKKKEKK